MSTPTADVSVRVAWADDAAAIAAVQLRVWRDFWSGLLPADALPQEPDELAAGWHQALKAPGDARNRVLVALEHNRVVGFTVTTPGSDPDCDPVADGELGELIVLPEERGKGHGSRLLQAGIDTLRADRFTRAVTWVDATDDALRRFLTDAGWAADSAHRELAPDDGDQTTDHESTDDQATGPSSVKQVRLHTALA